ncbi:MAG: hypothetical protein ACOY91_09625 [Pseudomonadota bacterium]
MLSRLIVRKLSPASEPSATSSCPVIRGFGPQPECCSDVLRTSIVGQTWTSHRSLRHKEFGIGHGEHPMKLFQISITVFVLAGISPGFAKVEQCRFIDSKPDREACYDRQARALAAKRAEAEAKPKPVDSLQEMKAEDEMLSRRLKSICRGC